MTLFVVIFNFPKEVGGGVSFDPQKPPEYAHIETLKWVEINSPTLLRGVQGSTYLIYFIKVEDWWLNPLIDGKMSKIP